MPFVLAHSVVHGGFPENQAMACADAIIERPRDDRAAVPALWELAFTNVLRTACMRQRMTADAAQCVIAWIVSVPIDVISTGVPNVVRAVECAVLLFGGTMSPTALGAAFVVVQIVAVLWVAELPFIGLKRACAIVPA